jgi:hypothetical protein
MIINKQIQTIDPHAYWGFSRSHVEDIKAIVTSYYEPLKKFYGVKTINNVLYEIQSKCRSILLLANQTPALTPIKIGDKVTYSVFDKRLSTLLFEYYILQIFTEYINLTKDPSMITKMLFEPEKEDTGFSSDFLIEQQLRFTETEQEYIEGDVSKLQENVAKLLVAYINMMMTSKSTIDLSFDAVQDRVFKLKETEKYTFTDRLRDLTEEERDVDTILKINKLGVWSKGLMKGIKEYDPNNYDQEKAMTEKIAALERQIRRNPNATDRNMDIDLEDALEEMDTNNFINEDENRMGYMNDDYNDGDYYGDEQENVEDYD